METLPVLNVPLDKVEQDALCRYTNRETIEDIVKGWVVSDCTALVTKYTCCDDPVVDYNSYPYTIANTEHPDYEETIARLRGRQIRTFIHFACSDYLDTIDWCDIYSRNERLHVFRREDGLWDHAYFGAKLADEPFEDILESRQVMWDMRIVQANEKYAKHPRVLSEPLTGVKLKDFFQTKTSESKE